MTALRLCLVADIHHGEDSFTKKGRAALPLMEEFAHFANDVKPNVVVDLGDRISDVDSETDKRLERDVADAFKAVKAPVFHVCGNHDRDHLSVADNAEILGQDLMNQTVDLGDWTLVLWRADSKIHRPDGFVLPEADLLWLAGVVRTASKPLAIFSHVPVSGHSQTKLLFRAQPRRLDLSRRRRPRPRYSRNRPGAGHLHRRPCALEHPDGGQWPAALHPAIADRKLHHLAGTSR
jgi:hypothetical protein